MTTPRQTFEMVARLLRAADGDDPTQARHIVRCLYGALCFEDGLDKQAALTEFAEHWDKVEGLYWPDNQLN